MKIAIVILVLSALLFFIKVKPQTIESYEFWFVIKCICFFSMIGSFIAILIMW